MSKYVPKPMGKGGSVGGDFLQRNLPYCRMEFSSWHSGFMMRRFGGGLRKK